ncbi:MAG TPA: response regulator [Chitinophagaceae bacterium]|nr:response regulator [Chitinophagaceae bacterium]
MKKKVLIIDDEQDFGLLLKGFFSRKKYDVQLAYTIEDGMKALNENVPDYIFLDNNLPDGLGWGEVDYIMNNYPKVQLNLISAYNKPGKKSGPFKILEKPLSLDDLNRMFD